MLCAAVNDVLAAGRIAVVVDVVGGGIDVLVPLRLGRTLVAGPAGLIAIEGDERPPVVEPDGGGIDGGREGPDTCFEGDFVGDYHTHQYSHFPPGRIVMYVREYSSPAADSPPVASTNLSSSSRPVFHFPKTSSMRHYSATSSSSRQAALVVVVTSHPDYLSSKLSWQIFLETQRPKSPSAL